MPMASIWFTPSTLAVFMYTFTPRVRYSAVGKRTSRVRNASGRGPGLGLEYTSWCTFFVSTSSILVMEPGLKFSTTVTCWAAIERAKRTSINSFGPSLRGIQASLLIWPSGRALGVLSTCAGANGSFPSDFWEETATSRAAHCTCWAWAVAAENRISRTGVAANSRLIKLLFIVSIAEKGNDEMMPDKFRSARLGVALFFNS